MSDHKPPQHQSKQPGIESKMHPRPQYEDPDYQANYSASNSSN